VVHRIVVGRLAAVAVLGAVVSATAGCADGADGSAASRAGTSSSSSPRPPDTSTTVTTDAGAGTTPAGPAGATPSAPTPTAETTGSTAPAVVAPPVTAARELVIVDLDVDHRPESELDDAGRAAQRGRLERAMDEVIAALGPHGELARRLTATAQMSVRVDAEGRRILGSHPLVAAVHDDAPSTPDAAG
jgi:hypothetical protein